LIEARERLTRPTQMKQDRTSGQSSLEIEFGQNKNIFKENL